MNRPPTSEPASDDFVLAPNPHLKAMLIRLRIEMRSCAKALRGDLLAEFWEIVDGLDELRPRDPGSV